MRPCFSCRPKYSVNDLHNFTFAKFYITREGADILSYHRSHKKVGRMSQISRTCHTLMIPHKHSVVRCWKGDRQLMLPPQEMIPNISC